MTTILWIILAEIVLIVLWVIFAFNRLVTLRNRGREAWSDIEVQLKRRYYLIPNLVETVKGYARHEQTAFEKVIQARSAALQGSASHHEQAAKENMLSGALKSIFALAEAYPDLKANANFLELQRELSDTENKIQAARRFFNSNVLGLNNATEVFPSNMIANIAITAGLPKPRIYIVDSPQPNAFATGRDAEHAVVAVTSGILKIMNRTELEGVLAHEMSHIGNRDMLVSTVVVVLVGVVQLLADMFLRSLRWGSGDRDRQVHPVFLLLGVALALLAPVAGILIQLAVSRKREFLADASGVLLTRYPDGLASALEKLGRDNTPMRQANHAPAHWWLADPYQGKKKPFSWFANFFMPPPPIEERIKRLRDMSV